MDKLKGIIKSKTMWFALALSVMGVMQANLDFFATLLTPSQAGWFTTGVGMVVAVLRWITTDALADK